MSVFKGREKDAIIGLAAAAFFSLFYITGIFAPAEERIYDLFLRFRAERDRIENVVFLDVDDTAIAYNGVFPWPRSVTASGLLRLKEYNAHAAIFDIEFIDKGPEGVDAVYLNQGLSADFDRSFGEISAHVSDFAAAVESGRLSPLESGLFAGELTDLIGAERDDLFSRTRRVARDNDEFLARSAALMGSVWGTLNLRQEELEGEQAERRPMAEELFSYPLEAAADAHRGAITSVSAKPFVDVLPALPSFAQSVKGAGFTNILIDGDGVRRRIFLAQNVRDQWYLQLTFAPLVHYLGDPRIILEKRRLILKNAVLPKNAAAISPAAAADTVTQDIVIPLDTRGRMMLDWPPTDYSASYSHISFAEFSVLEDLELDMTEYVRALSQADIPFFAQFNPALMDASPLIRRIIALTDATAAALERALADCSDAAFDEYQEYRRQSRACIRELLDLDLGEKIAAITRSLEELYGESAAAIADEAEYITTAAEYLGQCLDQYEETDKRLRGGIEGKFCIIGRVDTGTTDIGVNPFWGQYVNVGTHAVVLDTILSQSFITPLHPLWSILLTLLIPVFCLLSGKFRPGLRTALGFGLTALIALVPLLLFRFAGIFLGPLGAALAAVVSVIVREIISYSGSEREKSFIRKALSTYVSGDVVEEILADPSRFRLGGIKRHMTALFTDVQGFSTISEQLDPEDLVHLLNRYLTAMSDVLLAEKGTIDKYEGDAIIAFFGAPLDLPDHALRACLSAITMRRLEQELNRGIMEEKLSPSPLLTRIGINTGSMVAGNMGTKEKMNYTIMGNTVNLAARLEGVNKQYGTWILTSEDTVKETGGRLLTRRLDRVRVVGITEPVRLHELIETKENATAAQKEKAALFDHALDLFERREWEKAQAAFNQVRALDPADKPAALYLRRTGEYLTVPPKDDWDGVFNLSEK
ncbi:guanylate cyclase [Spirochaetia bacterium]|nr:guanylate cyclase [Spirochaetia bacterium]